MVEVTLRAIRSQDLGALSSWRDADDDPFGFFGFVASNSLELAFAANGLISDEQEQFVSGLTLGATKG